MIGTSRTRLKRAAGAETWSKWSSCSGARESMQQQAWQIRSEGNSVANKRIGYGKQLVPDARTLESISLQQFLQIALCDGAATAAGNGDKLVEMSVMSTTTFEEEVSAALHHAKLKPPRASTISDRMKKLQSSQVVRVTGCHEPEIVWYVDPPERYHGTLGLVEILWDAQGLDGVYSAKWLNDRQMQVSMEQVLRLIGADPPV